MTINILIRLLALAAAATCVACDGPLIFSDPSPPPDMGSLGENVERPELYNAGDASPTGNESGEAGLRSSDGHPR